MVGRWSSTLDRWVSRASRFRLHAFVKAARTIRKIRHRLPYADKPSTEPLLGKTIGANLIRSVDRIPDREVLVDVPSGRRWTHQSSVCETATPDGAFIASSGIGGGFLVVRGRESRPHGKERSVSQERSAMSARAPVHVSARQAVHSLRPFPCRRPRVILRTNHLDVAAIATPAKIETTRRTHHGQAGTTWTSAIATIALATAARRAQ